MKVGILTFQNAINYGAQMQCWALQETLKGLGHQVEIIQFCYPKSHIPFYRGIGIRNNGLLKGLTRLVLKNIYSPKMCLKFKEFQKKYLQLTAVCTADTIAQITQKFDAIITGSDQIWGWSYHKEAIYFIGWTPAFKGIRISYAPCCAKNYIEKSNIDRISTLLKQYNFLSVRNQETSNFVYQLTGLEANIVVDPTLLFDFNNYINTSRIDYPNYILTYILGKEIPGSHKAMLKEIRKKVGHIPIISIVLTENKPMLCPWADKVLWDADPIQWLNLIAHARFVYTDSFHATIFALKFRKQFIAYYTEPVRASRFIDMSSRYSLNNVIVTGVQDALEKDSVNTIINYEIIQNIIQEQIDESRSFLKKALSNEN